VSRVFAAADVLSCFFNQDAELVADFLQCPSVGDDVGVISQRLHDRVVLLLDPAV